MDKIAVIVAFISLIVSVGAVYFQTKHKAETFHTEWVRQVMEWANECLENISIMHTKIELVGNIETKDKIHNLAKLSALIDQGRLLFENEHKETFGKDKPSAYRGFRPTLLDELVDVYNAYKEFGNANSHTAENFSKHIVLCQRKFVSEIQDIIEPKWFYIKAKNFKRDDNDKNQ